MIRNVRVGLPLPRNACLEFVARFYWLVVPFLMMFGGAIVGPFFGHKNEAAFRAIIRGAIDVAIFGVFVCGRLSALKLGPRRNVFA